MVMIAPLVKKVILGKYYNSNFVGLHGHSPSSKTHP